ncbi:hypothetical protein OOK13_18790 [Streptomyces sp. NBC_00378]|uniref:hypothetical protein n=1 Tax=unclassified Streptomyces TaxID=2593676 RepID=UPI0022568D38|nr:MULTISPECIES: hypothetical protein [unclassified Streptomyces]MCX5110557.1 hypothetical protein [Streptomyces sp. NBC_00378]
MSRTQWCCLTAVLAVMLGLFCGPATAVTGGASPAAMVVTATTVGPDGPADTDAPVVATDSDQHPTPGCGRTRKPDDAPALPGRARAAYDQAPGLAEWGLPAATGHGPVHPPVRLKLRTPPPAAPTPVELSVLRV